MPMRWSHSRLLHILVERRTWIVVRASRSLSQISHRSFNFFLLEHWSISNVDTGLSRIIFGLLFRCMSYCLECRIRLILWNVLGWVLSHVLSSFVCYGLCGFPCQRSRHWLLVAVPVRLGNRRLLRFVRFRVIVDRGLDSAWLHAIIFAQLLIQSLRSWRTSFRYDL